MPTPVEAPTIATMTTDAATLSAHDAPPQRTAEMLTPPPGVHERLGVVYHGRVTLEDTRPFFDAIEAVHARGAKCRLLLDMGDLRGAELGVAWEKMHHMRALMTSIERLAVIGEQRWLDLWLKVATHIMPTEARHFHASELDAAWAWLDA
ncbi:MAG: STAS/SEC14 domain-containing protein [Nannocystaceae bacterium]